MQLKIYSGNQYLILTDDRQLMLQDNMIQLNIEVNEHKTFSIQSFLSTLQSTTCLHGVIFSTDFNLLEEKLRNEFIFITAAGGLVLNENNDSLLIFRRGKWDLPKGKLDEGETVDACALREVEEETGIKDTIIERFLTNTYHFYTENNVSICKETYWYLMHSPGVQNLVPQIEEQITAIKWSDVAFVEQILPDTFPMIKDVYQSYS
jgi:8-oxo-dGTP pyrophosphatase MutT (NUDIX family)